MERAVLSDKRGMSLVEVLIATFLFLVVSLALLQTSILSINYNMDIILRDEAVKIGDMLMSELRNKPFTSESTDSELLDTGGAFVNFTTYPTISRKFRGATVVFTPQLKITDMNTASTYNKEIDVTVSWTWRGAHKHSISTIMRRQ